MATRKTRSGLRVERRAPVPSVAQRDEEGEGRAKRGRPSHLRAVQTEAASKNLENGEEVPGPSPSLNRMLSCSSSVSSLSSCTVSEAGREVAGGEVAEPRAPSPCP